jgi:hypothetical protein
MSIGGCATSGGQCKGLSDEEAVQALLGSWKAAILEKNADKMLANFSESFAHKGYEYEAANKAALKAFVDDCEQQGYFDGVEVVLDDATTTINGAAATVAGIQYVTDQGSATIDLTLKKDKSGWLISDMAIQGI